MQRTVYSGASPQGYFITVSAQLYYKCYYGCRAILSIGDARGVYTGQLIYCGRRAMLFIGDIPISRRLAGSSKAPPSTTPPPERPGTMPSSLAITLTTAYGQETPPAKGGAQRTTAQSTTYDAHRRLFSFSSSDSSARAARTISSTLDNLRLDITYQTHEQGCKFSISLWHYSSSLRNYRDARTRSAERKKKER